LTLAALLESGEGEMPLYAAALVAACEADPPPFGLAWYGDKYRAVASDPQWMAFSLVANAEKEGQGSRKLWQLAGHSEDPDVADLVRRHAVDESRHAMLYIAMLELVFPDALSHELRSLCRALSPGYGPRDVPPVLPRSPREEVLDEIIQMNIGEIRTRIHQLLLRPVLTSYCPAARRPKLANVLDSLLRDETRHIAYTARLIEKAARAGFGAFVSTTLARRVHDFNEITLSEVGESRFVGE
jgi:hypothetical protein